MTRLRHIHRVAAAATLIVAFLFQGTWALAGTTGSIAGTVTDTNGTPIAGATVKATSPSQIATVTTDARGRYNFLSLAPDTYAVSIVKDGYNPAAIAGISVFADQNQTLATIKLTPALHEIAHVASTSAGSLVRAGTTADVYSVNAATAQKVSGLGGGGSLDQAYSAIATMPGAYVPVGQQGWYQAVYIRGGDYDQIGYEVDGVPMNHAFDTYPANVASSLGQQEVQVYAGAAPANAEGNGLAGYINQVIKTGTYPGYASSDIGIGSTTFYHKANVEAGGATPDRTFSYYVGIGGYDQAYRYADQFDGASYSGVLGPLLGSCPATAPSTYIASCYGPNGQYEGGGSAPWYVLGPYNYGNGQYISERENIINLHFAIPHKNNGLRDDIQILWQSEDLRENYTSSYASAAPYFNALGYGGSFGAYPESSVYNGALNTLVPAAGATAADFGSVSNFCFPEAPAGYGCGGTISNNQINSTDNPESMVKLQYQKDFSSNAYLRAYGYTTYSGEFDYYPVYEPFLYDVYAHSYGFSATFSDQLSARNLLTLQGSYTSANSQRVTNETPFYGGSYPIGVLVNGNNPNSGICYTAAGVAATCDNGAASFTTAQLQADALPTVTATSCGGGPCSWDIVNNGYSGENNTVKPSFGSGSITDEWDPNDRLHFNLGVRYDSFTYIPQATGVGAQPFWYAAWNASYCMNPATPSAAPIEVLTPGAGCGAANLPSSAVAGATYVPATISDVSNTQTYTVLQPRLSGTYTLNPNNVLRFSAGKYDQQPYAAGEQYTYFDQDLPSELAKFYPYGFTQPTHPLQPDISWNYDVSWEHHVKGTDLSWKLTPFLRQTQNQIEEFFLNPGTATSLVSTFNAGQQTSEGVELQIQKGDFTRNGLAGLLSYTYTYAFIRYTPLSNGATAITASDQAIAEYNAYTSACAPGGSAYGKSQYGLPLCGTTASGITATAAGNPYWNQPAQGLLDPTGEYAPYSVAATGYPGYGGYDSYIMPHVATLVLNYKHDKFAITPAIQFSAGNRYGYPIAEEGIDPTTGATYAVPIPDPATGRFDDIGAFTNPSRLTLSTQLTYTISPRFTIVATLANLYDSCFGGSKEAWTTPPPGVRQNQICSYGNPYASNYGVLPAANNYAAGTAIQPFQQNAYYGSIGTLPFNAYFDLRIRL